MYSSNGVTFLMSAACFQAMPRAWMSSRLSPAGSCTAAKCTAAAAQYSCCCLVYCRCCVCTAVVLCALAAVFCTVVGQPWLLLQVFIYLVLQKAALMANAVWTWQAMAVEAHAEWKRASVQ